MPSHFHNTCLKPANVCYLFIVFYIKGNATIIFFNLFKYVNINYVSICSLKSVVRVRKRKENSVRALRGFPGVSVYNPMEGIRNGHRVNRQK